MIRPGVETRAHRHSSSAVYFVREGSGTTEINGTSYQWSKGDVLVIAPSAVHKHSNASREPAVLFVVQDSPMLKALGFYREEASTEPIRLGSRRRCHPCQSVSSITRFRRMPIPGTSTSTTSPGTR